MARRGLQAVLLVLAAVTTTTGLLTVVTGAATVLDGGPVSPSLDSELRFFAAWYVWLGLVLIWSVPRVEAAGTVIRVVCGVLVLGAAGRIVSLVVVGAPHSLYLVLLGVELTLPVVLVPWQSAVARTEERLRGRPAP